MMKTEFRKLQSRSPDGVLMYPGEYVFTWVLAGSVWHLISIKSVDA